MDLPAYVLSCNERVERYIANHYGDVPRMRGVRFMKAQKPDDTDEKEVMFRKYAGQDVIYIHTRCGHCGSGFDSNDDTNYSSYGAKEWEESLGDLFLGHENDDFDTTYCSHYFKAVIDDDYNEIVRELTVRYMNERERDHVSDKDSE